MQPIDPRTDEEKIHAADLQEMGLHTATATQFQPGLIDWCLTPILVIFQLYHSIGKI